MVTAAAAAASCVLTGGVPSAVAAATEQQSPTTMPFEELEGRARAAYRGKRLDEAYDLLTRIIALEPEDGTWHERRAQVLVDLKRFQDAVDDFNKAGCRVGPFF